MEGMIWVMLAAGLLLAVFLRSLLLPMVFGALIGTAVFLVAPMLDFVSSPELIVFCGAAGLAFATVRMLVWGDHGSKSE